MVLYYRNMSNNDVTVRNIFIAIMLVTIIAGYDIAHSETPVYAKEIQTVVSTPTPTPEPIVVVEDTPENYIREVFGEYSDKAFLLLQGDECHENFKLDPYAVNDNTLWGGKGRDRGIFQISDYWHPSVTDEMAFDYKQNIDYAWRMFVNDDYSFVRWTCGKHYGI